MVFGRDGRFEGLVPADASRASCSRRTRRTWRVSAGRSHEAPRRSRPPSRRCRDASGIGSRGSCWASPGRCCRRGSSRPSRPSSATRCCSHSSCRPSSTWRTRWGRRRRRSSSGGCRWESRSDGSLSASSSRGSSSACSSRSASSSSLSRCGRSPPSRSSSRSRSWSARRWRRRSRWRCPTSWRASVATPRSGSGPLATVVQDLLSIVAYFTIAVAIL